MKRGIPSSVINAMVNEWPTRHEQGFLKHEITELLELLDIEQSIFWEELGPNTVMTNDRGESITYHTDIKRALRLVLTIKSKWVVLNSEGDILTYEIQANRLYQKWWNTPRKEIDPEDALDFLFGSRIIVDPIERKSWELNHYNSCRVISHKDLIELGHAILKLTAQD